MNSTFFLTFCMSNSVWFSCAFETVKLTSVTSFPELDQFYMNIKNDEWTRVIPRDQVDDVATKLQICEYIFNTPFFHMNGEDGIKLNSKETYKDLLEKNKEIFNELYGDPSLTGTSKKVFKRYFSFGRDTNPLPPKYYDENRYRPLQVRIPGYSTNETVFSCLTKDRINGKIKQYYVSNLYNVNKYAGMSARAIAGCFIFVREGRDGLVPRALAEEPSVPAFLIGTMETLYAHKKQISRPARIPSEDPLCQLSKSEKLRICNQIFSGSEFKGAVRFNPAFANVEEECKKRRVYLEEPLVIAKTSDVVYEEWMIGCKTLLIGEDWPEEKMFYVSNGFGSHRVFVYGELDDRYYIIYYTDNISV